ncbi:integrase, catalytic region, zinc finger, CCHC-type containing protein [Tanacetum coccineum]
MILNSLQNGPLVWPSVVEEDGTTRKKKYEELSVAEKLQADCDLKATNIVLQGLPPNVYAIVNHHKVAKEIWDGVTLLMQGTKLSLQEKECKLYDEFDKFSFVRGETLYHLPPEWSKFVTDVKLARDLHTTNYDQLYTYLEQHEAYENETPLMCERYHPLSHQTSSVPLIAYNIPQSLTQPLTKFPQTDSGLVVPMFNQGDDPIACLNNAMAILTAIASSRFPSTNNQLRTSSNLRNQVTIQDGRVTVQQVQRRQGQSYAGNSYKGNATSSGGNNAGWHVKVVKCYNCQGEGHMARQCTQPKKLKNVAWFKKKAMLAEAQDARKFLDEEKLAFLADPGIPNDKAA